MKRWPAGSEACIVKGVLMFRIRSLAIRGSRVKNGSVPGNSVCTDGVRIVAWSVIAGALALLIAHLCASWSGASAGNQLDDQLLTAASRGDAVHVRQLLQQGATLNVISSSGSTPLIFACSNGNINCIAKLLNAGANVNGLPINGLSPLHAACVAGHAPAVRLLLSQGADPNRALTGGITPLHVACCGDYSEIVELLLSFGANLQAKDAYGQTPIDHARMENSTRVLRLLDARGK